MGENLDRGLEYKPNAVHFGLNIFYIEDLQNMLL